MLIWVASYPRSGNTLTLLTLRNVFGLGNMAAIGGEKLKTGMPAIKLASGRDVQMTEVPDVPVDRQIEWIRQHRETFWVKTHRVIDADDPAPALHIVRDGRDVLVSQAHMTGARHSEQMAGLDFEQRMETLLRSRRGKEPPRGNWSSHTRRWSRRRAPTARIHFEQLVENPVGVVTEACRSIDYLPPERSGELPDFETLHAGDDVIFRRGTVGAYREDMPPRLERQFWRVHGEQMRELGYVDAEPDLRRR